MRCIILIHGFLGDHHELDSLIPDIQKIYDHIESFDLPGHGMNLQGEKFTVTNTLNFIVDTYDRLKQKYQTIDVLGYSMGGALALYLVSMREVGKLVLLSPSCKYINISILYKRLKTFFKTKKDLREAKKQNDLPQVETLKRRLRNIREDDKIAMRILRKNFVKVKFPSYFITFRNLMKEIINRVSEVSAPTLVLYGELDQLIPKKSIEYVKRVCIDAQIIIYDDVTHLMQLSNDNTRVIKDVVSFLDG